MSLRHLSLSSDSSKKLERKTSGTHLSEGNNDKKAISRKSSESEGSKSNSRPGSINENLGVSLVDPMLAIKLEAASIRKEVNRIVGELQLILRAYQEETGQKHTNADQYAMVLRQTPQEKMLEKLLESPYTSIFTPESAQKNNRGTLFNVTMETFSLALAPQRAVSYKDILFPNLNPNALSHDEIVKLSQRDYDILPYKEQQNEMHAYLLLGQMFRDLGLMDRFSIPQLTLYRFLYVISRRYRSVPFHNFFHAFNVTQTMYFFLRTCHARDLVSDLDQLALLIATICHDCDHPGLNNDFQKKAQTKIYHLHKKSILENHHFLHCVSLLTKNHTNILVNLSEEETSHVLTTLRDLILATDLSIHGLIMKGLGERKKILHKAWKQASPQSLTEEDRKLVLCSLIKCADLSNEIRTPAIGQKWAKFVLEEFFLQSDKEKEMGLPLTAFMDRQKIIIAKEQINFIEKLCMPLYTLVAAVFPQVESCVRQLEENRNGWKARLSTFFTNPEEIKKLPNQSIWERKQTKLTGNLTSILAGRATKGGTPAPKPTTPSKGK